MSGQPVNMGLQLFPPQPSAKKKPSRKPSTRRHAISPQSPPQSALERSESPAFPSDGRQSAQDSRRATPVGRQTPQIDRMSPITAPSPVVLNGSDIPRSQTSFSQAPTLVRSNSNSSQSSAAKPNIKTSPSRGEPIVRSIFPRYHPEIPLEHQPYYPTQSSPTHIPKSIINRSPYSPSISGRSSAGLQSPMSIGTEAGRFPRDLQDERVLEPSSTEELKELWKVTNGWRVSASEGRSFCLKMTSAVEEPVHMLSSSTQPFYTLRLDPTSTSAQMTVTRHDPNKFLPGGSSSPSIGTQSKQNTGMEVLSTTLEESVRRLPPNDGLVALLYPRAASNMAIEIANKSNHADEASVIAAAERECGRLVWDEDSQKNYLVHPAVSSPFVISVSSSPAWSRMEYTLEHPELPHNLVSLVRDGSGCGFLEIDTAVASRIDSFYIVDVAICAVLLVAIGDDKTKNTERFEAPPSLPPKSPILAKGKGKKVAKVEQMEVDIESQNSLPEKEKTKEKVPGFWGLIWMLIKCMVWTIAMTVKGIAAIIIGISKCLTRS